MFRERGVIKDRKILQVSQGYPVDVASRFRALFQVVLIEVIQLKVTKSQVTATGLYSFDILGNKVQVLLSHCHRYRWQS